MNTGEVSISSLREVLQISVKMNKVGRITYLCLDEWELVVAAADIEFYNVLPVDTDMILDVLQYVLALGKARPTCKKIPHNAASKYFHAVVKQINVSKE